jgi:hypothetical protein
MISAKMAMVNLLENWRPVGWFNLDLALYVIYAVILASLLLILRLQIRRRRRSLPLRGKSLATTIGVLLLVEFLAGSFFLVVFNAAGRSVSIELDSPALIAGEEGHPLTINKIRMKIPNGHSNGISTSISHFELIAVDVNTGQTAWNRKSYWQEYVIGHTSQGILTVNAKKKKLQFIDALTGKTALTEKELVAQFPGLADNLSYSFTDYRVVSPNELYLYALDGSYYKVDFAGRKAAASPEYKDFLSNSFANKTGLGISAEEVRAVGDQLKKLYPDLLETVLLHADSSGTTALVGYHEKRNEKTWTLSLVSLQEHNLLWKSKVDAPASGISGSTFAAIRIGNAAIIMTNGKQYKLDWETGKIVYEYIYRWNKSVNRNG